MFPLDLRTVLLGYTLSNLVCSIVLYNLWRQNHNRYKGLGLFFANYVLNFMGMLLLSFRNIIPDLFSIIFGNIFLAGGTLLIFSGLVSFLGRKIRQSFNYILFVVYICLHSWFTYVNPNLQVRTVIFSILIVVYCVQMAWILLSNKNTTIRKFSGALAVISIIYSVIGIARVVYTVVCVPETDLLQANNLEISFYIGFQIVYILLAFFIVLMVNRRLVFQLEEDIKQRELVEQELNLSQEKYSKAFKSSPTSILITREIDGKFLEVNESFLVLTGYTRKELMDQNMASLNMWANPEDRQTMIKQLRKEGSLKNYEFDGVIRSGEIRRILFSGELIKIGNEDCILSILLDITDRKQIESVLQMRLRLWEYAADHSTLELMQKTLDEIELLTRSKIGFFHLVNEVDDTLLLQAWSTNTKENFCKAESGGMHYPIADAGVWCDGVRQKKSIIHNNYATLENRKGLPDGHAMVTREMVVPVFENNKIVAVLGVGNKEIDYTHTDLEFVEFVSNIVWNIIREKQADEKIETLNKRLEELAMTDELTKIPNRRAFFNRGTEEVMRAARYHLPLSVIMLDIDEFKKINDTYGHEMGDDALQCVANTIKVNVREVDIIGRLGGEQFGILLPSNNAIEAYHLAERLRISIQNHRCLQQKSVSITASFGVSEFNDQIKTLDDLLRNADSAMYQAKRTGRNKVIIHEPDGEASNDSELDGKKV